jgi:putative membrane protein
MGPFAAFNPTVNPDPWRFQLHLEVWILVAGLVASYVYAVRVIGPKVAPEGRVVTRRQVGAFSAMVALLWLSSDWPVHDLAEEYLYSVHMIQHMALSYFVPPLALLATPEWLARLLLGQGRAYARARVLVLPVVAAVTYNAVVMITHIPALVNRSAEGGPLHYGLHVILVTTSLMMWTPICGPIPEWRIGHGAQMIYLFSMSLLPTIPAGWLTFAENAVYDHYDTPVRVWGMTVLSDQQAAGGIMKLGGSVFMWMVIIFVFFRRFMGGFAAEQTYARDRRIPDSEITGTDPTLTYADVEKAFSATRPAPESPSDQR